MADYDFNFPPRPNDPEWATEEERREHDEREDDAAWESWVERHVPDSVVRRVGDEIFGGIEPSIEDHYADLHVADDFPVLGLDDEDFGERRGNF
jgi:hypothetical protein